MEPDVRSTDIDSTEFVVTPSESVGGRENVRLAPGRVVPGTRYRLVRWLGEGGMGVIYEAQHLALNRKIAVKVIREDFRQRAEAARKFRHEAWTVGQMGSEFVVDIIDVGELSDGRIFIALELIDGHDLFEELEGAPMALERLFPILRQVCKGLAAAHSAGVLHRDIKPENILVHRRRGREDAIKVVDFGIATMKSATRPAEGRPAGTPAYMAPERWSGLYPEDERVDVYSVGCLAYELLAGRTPFADDSPNIMAEHLDAPVPPLAAVAPTAEVPLALERVIQRCLSKTPDDRYRDMADLEAALCEAQIAIGLRTAWDDLDLPEIEEERRDGLLALMPGAERLDSAPRLKRWLIAGGIGILAAGAAGVGYAMTHRVEVAVERSEVETLAELARHAAARAYWIYPPIQGNEETAYRWVLKLEALDDEAAPLEAQELRNEFAATLNRLGDRYWKRDGGSVFAIDYYAQALVFDPENPHARVRAPLTPGEAAVLREKATELDFTEDELEALMPLVFLAEDDENKAFDALEAYIEQPRGTIASERRARKLLRQAGRAPRTKPPSPSLSSPSFQVEVPIETDEEVVRDADDEAVRETSSSTRSHERARPLAMQGERLLERGHRRQAEQLFHRALAADQHNITALRGLSELYFAESDYHQAMNYARKVVRLRPKDARARLHLGDTYFRLLRYRDAETEYREARRLGHASADKRLRKVQAKLGP